MTWSGSVRRHANCLLSLSEGLPLVIIDMAENIGRFLPQLAELMFGGIVALDDVEVPSLAARNE